MVAVELSARPEVLGFLQTQDLHRLLRGLKGTRERTLEGSELLYE